MDTKFRKCFVCSHEWTVRGNREPRKCPNPNCRSKKWRDGIDRRKNNGAAKKPELEYLDD